MPDPVSAEDATKSVCNVVLAALEESAPKIPAVALLEVCLLIQEKLEPLTAVEPTAKPATSLVTRLGGLARQANEAIVEHQKKVAAEASAIYDRTFKVADADKPVT